MLTIAWDVDDVLNDLMRSWFENYWLSGHPNCRLAFDDLKENPPHAILGVTQKEYLASLDAYRLSEAAGQMQPNPELLIWFQKYGGSFRHIALTAAPLKTAHISAYWVLKHFGEWIRTFHFVPSGRDHEEIPVYDNSKSEFLQWIEKVDLLIDDSARNIEEAQKIGIRGILVSRPWNIDGYSIQEVIHILTEAEIKGFLD